MNAQKFSLIAGWAAVLAACDPSLGGYDTKRPSDGGRDAPASTSMRDHSSPQIDPTSNDGALSAAGGSAGSAGRGGNAGRAGNGGNGGNSALDASEPGAAGVPSDSGAEPRDASTCTTGARSSIGLVVASATELGLLERPPLVYFRDGASTGLFDGTPVWLFHDTYLNGPAVDGTYARRATAGIGSLTHPAAVVDDLDGFGAPASLLSLTPEEQAVEASDGGAQRIVLWPNSLVVDGTVGYVFYLKALLKPPFAFDYLGTGVARLAGGKVVAARDEHLLFGPDEPKFNVGAVVSDDYLYLYACGDSADSQQPCYVSRAGKGGWTQRSAYEFWDGCAWTADVAKAAPVMTGVPNEMTVSYNRYLEKFLMVYTPANPFNDAAFRTAPRPEGPWSDPVRAFTQVAPDPSLMSYKYGAKEHPEFASPDGKSVLVSYPLNLSDGKSNEIHLVKVTFP